MPSITNNTACTYPVVNEDFTLDGNNYNSDSFDYDKAGNLTYDGNFAFEYDAWHRLIGLAKATKVSTTIKKGNNFASYRYDGRGRRITRAITDTGVTDATYHYYYDGDRLIETRNGSDQSITQYVWGTRYVDELCQIAHNGNPLEVGTQMECGQA